jgi:hypothetical protein
MWSTPRSYLEGRKEERKWGVKEESGSRKEIQEEKEGRKAGRDGR